MTIDHIGVVVSSLERGIQRWEDLFGYRPYTDIVTNTRQKVRVVFLHKPQSIMIKLLEPSEPDSPIAAFAKRGGGLHHICFLCENLQQEIAVLVQRGARLLVLPEPGEAFNNKEIAFLFAAGNLNIELIDTVEKAAVVQDHAERAILSD
jgi:methylmalonyl-CoA/ethylmalonyl-CoA epimerase